MYPPPSKWLTFCHWENGSGKQTKIICFFIEAKGFLSVSFNFHRQTEDSVANVIDVNSDLIQAKRENFGPGSNKRGPFLHVISGIFLIKN